MRWSSRAVMLATCLWLAERAQADLVEAGNAAAQVAGSVPNLVAGMTLSGSGTFQGSGDPAAPWYMDGAVQGTSIAAPIMLQGYIKGSGTFENVVFDGTFSPGHSPVLITLGSTVYTSSNVLEMEIGGLLPGSQHDKIVHTGMAILGGTLDVVLINAFMPQAGNTFDLFDWTAGNSGTFATLNLPGLQAGLAWDASDLYLGGQLSVTAVPEASAFLLMGVCLGVGLAGAAARRVLAGIRTGSAARVDVSHNSTLGK